MSQSHYDPEDATTPQSLSLLDQTKSDLYIITAAGLGGAVLGLSTLSFAAHPSKQYDNIWTGAAIGIIVGVVYVAYRQALGPGGMWSDAPQEVSWDPRPIRESTHDFLAERFARVSERIPQSQPLSLNWNFSF